MTKKIIAVGGGDNGKIRSDGTVAPYEVEKIDREIIRISGKNDPRVLILAHAKDDGAEEKSFSKLYAIYHDRFGLETRLLKKETVINDINAAEADLEWSDIIYEEGGNTMKMMKLWQDTGFDRLLYKAWQNGKVMCGVSAGGICWFRSGSSDSLKSFLHDPNAPMSAVDGLGFVPAFFTPHANEPKRNEVMKEWLKDRDEVGFALSNCAAVEIVDGRYRLLTGDPVGRDYNAFGQKAYWKNGEYIVEDLTETEEFEDILK